MITKAKLTELFEQFIDSTNRCEDDWPVITDKEWCEFWDLVHGLAEFKWGVDCDGDSPIRVRGIRRKINAWVVDPYLLTVTENEGFHSPGDMRSVVLSMNALTDWLRTTIELQESAKRQKEKKNG